MTRVLALNSSIFGDGGQSAALLNTFLEALAEATDVQVTRRDLGTNPVPHLDAATFAAFGTAEDERSPEQQALVALSDELVAELKAADLRVIGMPMYNFGAPSGFKAWIDHIARAGVTFQYTSEGVKGLTGIQGAVVLGARGGSYEGTPQDSQLPWLKTMLGFLGLADVDVVLAEGLARSATRDTALGAAQERARTLAQEVARRGAGGESGA